MKLSFFSPMILAGLSTLVRPSLSLEECILTDPIALDEDGLVTLQQFVNQDEGTMTMKVHYTGGRSWIGIGINEAGQALMTPATVVMGFGSEDGTTTTPMTFSLTTKAFDGSGVNPTPIQTLQNATFEQTEESSTLLFTQSIEDFGGGSPVRDDSQWIFAIGSPDNGPGHPIYGSFQVVLNPCGSDPSTVEFSLAADEIVSPESSPVALEDPKPDVAVDKPTTSSLECVLTEPIALDDDGLVTLQQHADKEKGIMTMKVHYSGGRSWIGVGINEAGQALMTPATAVMGFGSDDGTTTTPMTYSLTTKALDGSGLNPTTSQTLLNATFEQTEDSSTLRFSQSIADFGGGNPITDDSQWIFAIGSPDNGPGHPIYGSFQLALNPCGNDPSDAASGLVLDEIEHPQRSLWIAHGVLLALAWGLCSPVAIGASVVRDGFDRLGFPKGTWYKVHFYMNVLTVWLTIIGFILAVVATSKENGAIHWSNKHHKMGMAIFILAVFQAAGGVGRPGLPKPLPPAKERKTMDERTQHSEENQDSGFISTGEDEKKPKKTNIRVGWEWGHRIIGLGVVALAWSNCHSGIDWITKNFPDLDRSSLVGAFWAVAGGIAAIVIVLSLTLRMTSKPKEATREADAPLENRNTTKMNPHQKDVDEIKKYKMNAFQEETDEIEI